MVENNLVVTKSNALIEASYKVSLNEQRLLLSCIAQVDGRRTIQNDNQFVVSVREFSETYGIQEKHAYGYLKEAADSLYERDIKTFDGKTPERFRWVYHVKYSEGRSCVKLSFSPTVIPYLTMLNKKFTTYKFKQISSMKSVYSIRLFEMMMQFKSSGYLTIKLAAFKSRLELEEKYERFSNLKARIIDPSIKELKCKNSMEISWKASRVGRKVEKLEFWFKQSDQLPLEL